MNSPFPSLARSRFQHNLTWTLSMCCNRKYMEREPLKPWFNRVRGTEMHVLVKKDRPVGKEIKNDLCS